MFVHPSERPFYYGYYSQLDGATIVAVMLDADGSPLMAVRLADGTLCHLHVYQDTEGNGPGFIHGLPTPAPSKHEGGIDMQCANRARRGGKRR